MNGQPLPATLQAFPQPTLTAALLHGGFGAHTWEYCLQGDGGPTFESIQIGDLGDGRFPVTYPDRLGSLPDTLTLDGDSLRWGYAAGVGSANGRDGLTFTASPGPSTDPTTCGLPG